MNSFLNALLSKVQLNNERVIEVINEVVNGNTDEVLRILAYISGSNEKPEIPQEIHNETLKVKMTAYNFTLDKVSYSGFRRDIIYVQDEVTAAQVNGKYAGETVNLNEIKYRGYKCDDYPFNTYVWRSVNDSMCCLEWIEKAK